MIGPIQNAAGERLDTCFTPGRAGADEVVIIAHGVTSHHDRPWLVALSEALAGVGVASLRVSFSGNGDSEGRYEDSCIRKEVEDLGHVIDALPGHRIAYVGHSMGGAVGVLRAARDDRIAALVSLAGMVHVQRFMERHFGTLVPGVDVMLGKPRCPLTQAFLEDARAIGDVLGPARDVQVPWLIVHGDADDIVPLQDSLDLVEAIGAAPQLVRLPGVDHRFTGHHAAMTGAVVDFLRARFLRPA